MLETEKNMKSKHQHIAGVATTAVIKSQKRGAIIERATTQSLVYLN